MDATRFDRISRRFAERRLSRRKALAAGGAGIAAAALGSAPALAQDATPAPDTNAPTDYDTTPYLFVQSYHSGSIVPTEGEDGRYTVTLEQGSGQTIYFADRPSRDVGVSDTPQFLEGLGFPEGNPPNAALIVETAAGETDTAVVELFNPTYDPVNRGVTYDVAVLETWQDDLELGFREAPADLATLAPAFGAAHLFIDDCPDHVITCLQQGSDDTSHRYTAGFCYTFPYCRPCRNPAEQCNELFPDFCEGDCLIDCDTAGSWFTSCP